MIAQVELDEVIENLEVTPLNKGILLLVPSVSETTDSGIIKGEQVMQDEENSQELFLTVVKVADDVTSIKAGDKVYSQGQVLTFVPEILPKELDVAPEGYTIGLTFETFIKMKM